MMPSLQTFQRFPVFAQLDQAQLKNVALLAHEIELSKGQSLFHEGEQATNLYLILEGSVELLIKLGRRDPHPASLETLGIGDLVGWSALVAPYVYTSSAAAATDARLLELDSVRLRGLMDEDHEIGYRLMAYSAQVIRRRLTNMYIRFVSLTEA